MKQTLKEPKSQHFTVQDWLKLHGLEAQALQRLLCVYTPQAKPLSVSEPKNLQSFAAKDVWSLTAEALVQYLPALQEQILYVRDFCEVDFEAAEGDKPYTLDRGAGVVPFVSICYRNTAADILCVAHEFGHALQYHLVQGRFVPPVVREIAAFVAEKALLDHMRSAGMAAVDALEEAWRLDSNIYLERDLQTLTEALKAPDTTSYDYHHNYPLARLYVEAQGCRSDTASLTGIFEGDVDLAECFLRLEEFVMTQPKDNYLPELPKPNSEFPSLAAYASLGATVLLDMAQPESDAEQSIGDYYETRLGHLQKATVFIGVDEGRKPYGYALWDAIPDDIQSLNASYIATPFGEEEGLLKQLRLRHSNEVIE
jgi:hypothetical protein